MPFRSRRQQRFAFANKMPWAKKWAREGGETGGKAGKRAYARLPETVKPKRRRGKK